MRIRREAERRGRTGPRHRHPAAVAAALGTPGALPGRILQHLVGQLDVGQPQFFTVVDEHRARQGQHRHRHRPGAREPTRATPVAADLALDVVIRQRPGRARSLDRGRRQCVLDRTADARRVELRAHQPEVEAHVQFVGPEVFREVLVVEHPDLSDGHRVRVVVEHRPDPAVDVVHALVVEPGIVILRGQHLDVGDGHVG